MCRTPVGGPSGVEVNIINVIGAALDNTRNYDYRYFVEDRSVQSRIQLLQSFYEEIFRKIYVCAEDHGFRTICLPLFGAASFADLYPGGSNSFKYEVWFPVFRKMRELHSKFRILFMGTQGYSVYLSDEMKEEFPDVGYFPEMISKIDPNDTLIVNAWDPYSFVGNGNSGDNSLDGYIGRETACAMLCWPLANPYMRFVGI
jgi:hypothetical protein